MEEKKILSKHEIYHLMTQPELAHSTPVGRMYARSTLSEPTAPSITTIIAGQAIDLSRWYGRMAAQDLAANPRLLEILGNEKKLKYAVDKASKAAEKYRQDAAERGDRVHNYAEHVALKALGQEHQTDKALQELIKHGQEGFAASFDDWWRTYDVRPVKAEVTVWNTQLHYAGTLDLVATIGGRTCLVDYKTKTTDWRGMVRLPDEKVVMQLVAGLKATESLADAQTGQWEEFTVRRQDPLLLAVSIGEQGTRTVQANPKQLDVHWRKFVSLLRLWESNRQSQEQEALLALEPPIKPSLV